MSVVYPLKISPNGRYLVDSANAPFLVCGESTWDLSALPSLTDARTVMDTRQSQGFNSLLVEAMEFFPFGGSSPQPNTNGDIPFDGSNNFDNLNEAYFSHLDTIISDCASRGICVFLFPCYEGFLNANPVEGWYDVMVTNGAKKMRQFGRKLGTRYKNYDNIVWVMNADRVAADANLSRQIAYGIVGAETAAGRPKLMTSHLTRGTPSGANQGPELWCNVGTAYTQGDQQVYAAGKVEYQRTQVRPAVLIEGWYEGQHSMTRLTLRRETYWAFLSGLCGHFYGNNTAYQFLTGWQAALTSAAAGDQTVAFTFLQSFAWYNLVPDFAHTVTVSGFGTDGATSYCTTARTPDGLLVLCYVPSANSQVVDMGQLRGSVTARWFDPSNGTYTSIGTNLASAGLRTFPHPGLNAGGDADWVLVLQGT